MTRLSEDTKSIIDTLGLQAYHQLSTYDDEFDGDTAYKSLYSATERSKALGEATEALHLYDLARSCADLPVSALDRMGRVLGQSNTTDNSADSICYAKNKDRIKWVLSKFRTSNEVPDIIVHPLKKA